MTSQVVNTSPLVLQANIIFKLSFFDFTHRKSLNECIIWTVLTSEESADREKLKKNQNVSISEIRRT